MNKAELVAYLERVDSEWKSPAALHIHGSAAFMLLDEPEWTSLDIASGLARKRQCVPAGLESSGAVSGQGPGVRHEEALANVRRYCCRPEIRTHVIPGNLVRDIGLPPLCRS